MAAEAEPLEVGAQRVSGFDDSLGFSADRSTWIAISIARGKPPIELESQSLDHSAPSK